MTNLVFVPKWFMFDLVNSMFQIRLEQGDQIGRFWAFWAIDYFGQFFENWATFFKVKDNFDKDGFG
jgi:hypothetical protein